MLKWLLFLIPSILLAQSDSKMLRSSNTIPDGHVLISDNAYGPRYVKDSGVTIAQITNGLPSGLAYIVSNQVFRGVNGFTNYTDFYFLTNWPSTNTSAYRLFGYYSQAVVTNSNDIGTNVQLLLHGDGTNASTWFPDSSSNNCAIVDNAGAHVTNVFKIGNGSMNFNGAQYLSCTNTVNWDFGTNDFSIDMWLNPAGNPAFGFGVLSALSTGPWFGYMLGSFDGAENTELRFVVKNSGLNVNDLSLRSTNTIPLNAWTHVAVGRIGTNFNLFTNGIVACAGSYTGQVGHAQSLTIGRVYNNYNDYYFNGKIDEVRVIKGSSAFTNAFTPPSLPYGIANVVTNHTYFLYAIGPDGSTNQIAPVVSSGGLSVDTNGLSLVIGASEAMRIKQDRSVKLFDMSCAPATPSGGALIFSTNGEMRVMDASGNITQISPHNDKGELVIDSENAFTGVREIVNVTLMAKYIESIIPKDSPYKGQIYQSTTNYTSLD